MADTFLAWPGSEKQDEGQQQPVASTTDVVAPNPERMAVLRDNSLQAAKGLIGSDPKYAGLLDGPGYAPPGGGGGVDPAIPMEGEEEQFIPWPDAPPPEPEEDGIYQRMIYGAERGGARFVQSISTGQSRGVENELKMLEEMPQEDQQRYVDSVGAGLGLQYKEGPAPVGGSFNNVHFDIGEFKAKRKEQLQELYTAQDIRRTAISGIPVSDSLQKIGEAETFGEAWEVFKGDWVGTLAEVTAESAPTMLPGIVAGIFGGPVPAALMMGGSSYLVESESDVEAGIMELAQDIGADLATMEGQQAVADDPRLQKIMADAEASGLIIGAMDTLAGLLPGIKILGKAKPVREALVQTAAQMASGAGGEAGAQLYTEGEITEPGSVMLEALAEGPFGAVEVAASKYGANRLDKADETTPPGTGGTTPVPETNVDPDGTVVTRSGAEIPTDGISQAEREALEGVLDAQASEEAAQSTLDLGTPPAAPAQEQATTPTPTPTATAPVASVPQEALSGEGIYKPGTKDSQVYRDAETGELKAPVTPEDQAAIDSVAADQPTAEEAAAASATNPMIQEKEVTKGFRELNKRIKGGKGVTKAFRELGTAIASVFPDSKNLPALKGTIGAPRIGKYFAALDEEINIDETLPNLKGFLAEVMASPDEATAVQNLNRLKDYVANSGANVNTEGAQGTIAEQGARAISQFDAAEGERLANKQEYNYKTKKVDAEGKPIYEKRTRISGPKNRLPARAGVVATLATMVESLAKEAYAAGIEVSEETMTLVKRGKSYLEKSMVAKPVTQKSGKSVGTVSTPQEFRGKNLDEVGGKLRAIAESLTKQLAAVEKAGPSDVQIANQAQKEAELVGINTSINKTNKKASSTTTEKPDTKAENVKKSAAKLKAVPSPTPEETAQALGTNNDELGRKLEAKDRKRLKAAGKYGPFSEPVLSRDPASWNYADAVHAAKALGIKHKGKSKKEIIDSVESSVDSELAAAGLKREPAKLSESPAEPSANQKAKAASKKQSEKKATAKKPQVKAPEYTALRKRAKELGINANGTKAVLAARIAEVEADPAAAEKYLTAAGKESARVAAEIKQGESELKAATSPKITVKKTKRIANPDTVLDAGPVELTRGRGISALVEKLGFGPGTSLAEALDQLGLNKEQAEIFKGVVNAVPEKAQYKILEAVKEYQTIQDDIRFIAQLAEAAGKAELTSKQQVASLSFTSGLLNLTQGGATKAELAEEAKLADELAREAGYASAAEQAAYEDETGWGGVYEERDGMNFEEVRQLVESLSKVPDGKDIAALEKLKEILAPMFDAITHLQAASIEDIDSNQNIGMNDVLDVMIDSLPSNSKYYSLAVQLRSLNLDVPVHFFLTPSQFDGAPDVAGKFFWDENDPDTMITIVSKPENFARQMLTLLHEMVHAASSLKYHADKRFHRYTNELHRQALSHLPKNFLDPAWAAKARFAVAKANEAGLDTREATDIIEAFLRDAIENGNYGLMKFSPGTFYGLFNPKEFLAEATTNPRFQAYLSQNRIVLTKELIQGRVRGPKRPSIMGSFVSAIQKLVLKISPRNNIMKEVMFLAARDLMDQKQADNFYATSKPNENLRQRDSVAASYAKMHGDRTNKTRSDPEDRMTRVGNTKKRAAAKFPDDASAASAAESITANLDRVVSLVNQVQDPNDFTDPALVSLSFHLRNVSQALVDFDPKFQKRVADIFGVTVNSNTRNGGWIGDLNAAAYKVVKAHRAKKKVRSDESVSLEPESTQSRNQVLDAQRDTKQKIATQAKDIVKGAKGKGKAAHLAVSGRDAIERDNRSLFDKAAKKLGIDNPLTRFNDAKNHAQTLARKFEKRAYNILRSMRDISKAARSLMEVQMRDITMANIDPTQPLNSAANAHIWTSPEQNPKPKKRKDGTWYTPKAKKPKIRKQYRQRAINARDNWLSFAKRNPKAAATLQKMAALSKEIHDTKVSFALEALGEAFGFDTKTSGALGKAKTVEDIDAIIDPNEVDNLISQLERAEAKDDLFALSKDEKKDLKKKVAEAEARAAAASSAKTILHESSIKGWYFPLRRYGDYVVSTGPEVTGDDRYVSFHESQGQAERVANEMNAISSDENQVGVSLKLETTSHSSDVKSVMSDLKRRIRDPETGAKLDGALSEILAANASYQSQIKRHNVDGAAASDMARGFEEYVQVSKYSLGDIRMAHRISDAIKDMNLVSTDLADSGLTTDERIQAGRVKDEITKRNKTEGGDRKKNKWQKIVGNLGFLNFLGAPSYWALNSTQTYVVTLPYVMAKYGELKGPAALLKAQGTVVRAAAKAMKSNDKSYEGFKKQLPPGARRIVEALEGDNIIQSTIAHEFGDLLNPRGWMKLRDNAMTKPLAQTGELALDVMEKVPEGIEHFNRISTALAVYALSKGDYVATRDAVNETQMNYDTNNRARLLKTLPGATSGDTTPYVTPIMMFKTFGVGMAKLYYGAIFDAVYKKGGRPEALKLAGYLMTTHSMFAGVAGGLMIAPIQLAIWGLNSVLDPDDEWKMEDAAAAAGQELAGDFGATMLERGLPAALLGVDMSRSINLGNLVWMGDERLDYTEHGDLQQSLASVFGPVASYATNAAVEGWRVLSDDPRAGWDHFLQAAFPIKMASGMTEAYRYSQEGMRTTGELEMIPAEEFKGLLRTALGFQTTQKAETKDAYYSDMRLEMRRSDRKNDLVKHANNAIMNDDWKELEKILEDMQAYNLSVPAANYRVSAGDMARLRSRRRTAQRDYDKKFKYSN